MFVNPAMGELVAVTGSDPVVGSWEHKAFVPNAPPQSLPDLVPQTYFAVMEARAALAALDSTARQLPNPRIFRLPALRLEAQSTSELEGTYAPLAEVLAADEEAPGSSALTEILNYVTMANHGFERVAEGWPLTIPLLAELQGILMRGLSRAAQSGDVRTTQVVIGRRAEARPTELPIVASRFVPAPPGPQLRGGLQDLLDWAREDHAGLLDPVMVAGLAHYQFETLHPFTDGNGRIGRFLIVLQLVHTGVLSEPTLTVSPWFEARRAQYFDSLLGVSTRGDWDGYLQFFAQGLRQAAIETREDILALVEVQAELHDVVRASPLRADTAHAVVDLAIANPSLTVRKVQGELGGSYGRANKVVAQLVDLGILRVRDAHAYQRRFFAPRVLDVLARHDSR